MYIALLAICLWALATAIPFPLEAASSEANAGLNISGALNDKKNGTFTAAEIHANVLKHYPAENVLTSENLYPYLLSNQNANHTIYLSDTRAFIDLRTVHQKQPATDSSNPYKRQGGGTNPCFGYTSTYTTSSGSYWSAWSPVSSCLYTGASSAAGSQALAWSTSVAYQESGSVT